MKDILESTKATISKAAESIVDNRIVNTVGGAVKSATEKGATIAVDGYEKTGVKKIIDHTSEKFDEVSGKAILDEVKRLVQTQALYNDVLASKLQEALDRIDRLEAEANQK